jgi:hypothetical protein
VLDHYNEIMRYFLGATLFGLGALCFKLAVMSRFSVFDKFLFELASVISAMTCGAVFAGLMDNTAQKTHHRMGLVAGLFLTIGSFVLGNVLLTFGSWTDQSLLETLKTMFWAVFIGWAFGYWVMILALPFGALSGWGFFYLRQKTAPIIQKYITILGGIFIVGVVGGHAWGEFLHQLIAKKQYKIAKQVFTRGVAINQKDEQGQTPLHNSAAIWLDTTMIQFLLQGGANVEATDDQGETPLYAAVGVHLFQNPENHIKSVKLLLEHGANPNHRNKRQETALHKAMDSEIAHLLLQHGADPNAQEFEGQTPLQKVAEAGRSETVKVLLAAGANPNIKDNYGNTPLHDAWTFDVARLLLNAGAQWNVTNQKGRTPAEEIRIYGRDSVAIFLESLQKKKN